MIEVIRILGFVGFWVIMVITTARINVWFWASYRTVLAANSAPDRLAIYCLCVRLSFQPKSAWMTVADEEVAAAMKKCGERWTRKLPPFLYALSVFLSGGFAIMLVVFLTAVLKAKLAG